MNKFAKLCAAPVLHPAACAQLLFTVLLTQALDAG